MSPTHYLPPVGVFRTKQKKEMREKKMKALALFASRSNLLCNILAPLIVKNTSSLLEKALHFLPCSWPPIILDLGICCTLRRQRHCVLHFASPQRTEATQPQRRETETERGGKGGLSRRLKMEVSGIKGGRGRLKVEISRTRRQEMGELRGGLGDRCRCPNTNSHCYSNGADERRGDKPEADN